MVPLIKPGRNNGYREVKMFFFLAAIFKILIVSNYKYVNS
jgi:hypothetical protein